MIECVVQLLSRFPFFQVTHILHASTIAQHLEAKLLAFLSWRLWERATSEQLSCVMAAPSVRSFPCPSHNPPFIGNTKYKAAFA